MNDNSAENIENAMFSALFFYISFFSVFNIVEPYIGQLV